ncbi:suppressor of fused domain protein [Paenibacillus oralis]|uniref:Suppressor of fused domain protein n=1 Tax=Paenibacillus oralis TaxID=2490856 RepID=A0A3P3UCJ3_9BACL|nr:suppressor of fused domain protein [Paenibacillus oralis]
MVHIDIFLVPANNARSYHTLITSGMNALPANTADGEEEWRYTELLMYLPSTWDVSPAALEEPQNYWPLAWLRKLGRFPHENKTWFGLGDTIPNGEPPKPIGDQTQLSNFVLLPFLHRYGFNDFLDKLDTAHFSDVLNLERENMCG